MEPEKRAHASCACPFACPVASRASAAGSRRDWRARCCGRGRDHAGHGDQRFSSTARPTSPAPDSVFLIADVHATKDDAHGFTGFIPYLSISFSLTKDGEPTYKKTGLLYPTAGKNGPRYVGITEMGGPGQPIT